MKIGRIQTATGETALVVPGLMARCYVLRGDLEGNGGTGPALSRLLPGCRRLLMRGRSCGQELLRRRRTWR